MNETVLVAIKGDATAYLQSLSKAQTGTKEFSEKTGAGLGGLKAGFLAVAGAVTGIIVVAKKAVDAFLEQDKANQLLLNSLKRIGETDAYGKLTKQAEDFQRKTTYADEVSTAAMTRLIDMGLNSEQAMAALPAVMDLATAKGMDLNSAATLVGKAAGGMTSALSRAGISADELTAKGGGLQGTLAALQSHFGGAAIAAGSTFAGQLQIVKNVLDDLMEKIGAAIVPLIVKVAQSVVPLLEMLVKLVTPFIETTIIPLMGFIDQISKPLMELLQAILTPLLDILKLLMNTLIMPLLNLLKPILGLLKILEPVLKLVALVLRPILIPLEIVLKLLEPLLDILSELLDTVLKPITTALDMLTGKLDGIVNEQMAKLEKTIKSISKAFKDAMLDIKDAIQSAVNFVIDKLNKIPGVKLGYINLGLGGEGPIPIPYLGTTAGIGTEVKPKDKGGAGGAGGAGTKAVPPVLTPNWVYEMTDALDAMGRMTDDLTERWAKLEEKVAEILEMIKGFGAQMQELVEEVIGEPLRGLITDIFEPLKIEVKETDNIFVKFFKDLVNSIVQFVTKMIAEALAFAATLLLMNLIVPGSGTAFAKLVGGGGAGGALGGLFNLFGTAGKLGGVPGMQSGGPLEEGLFYGHKDEYVLNANQTSRLGAMLDTFLNAMSNVMRQPALAVAGLGRPVVNLSLEGAEGQVIGSLVKIYEKSPDGSKRLLGRATLDAQDKETTV